MSPILLNIYTTVILKHATILQNADDLTSICSGQDVRKMINQIYITFHNLSSLLKYNFQTSIQKLALLLYRKTLNRRKYPPILFPMQNQMINWNKSQNN